MASLLTQIKVRKDTYENIKNLVLTQGEPGFAHDTGDYAVGNGTNKFSDICFKLQKGVINNGTSTDNAIARFDGTTGRVVQNSEVLIQDNGSLKTVENKMGLQVRTHANYEGGWVYGTTGNEALTLALQNPVTAFQIVYGTKPSAFGTNTWQTVTPLFQTKDGKVIINRQIDATADTTNLKLLDVNGTLGVSGQITSTVAAGTAPFAVTSTTVNTNLNADLLDGKHASEFQPAGDYLTEESDTLQTVTDRGATTTKGITVDTLSIGNTTATGHINFARGGWNYIKAPNTNSIIGFITGKSDSLAANATLAIDSTSIFPGWTNGAKDIGSSSYQWNNIYMKGNIIKDTYTLTLPSKTGTIALLSDLTGGTITSVVAGNGLTGGGTSGEVTLNVGAGTGISVTADAVALATYGTAGTYGPTADATLVHKGTFTVPKVVTDDYGRVTAANIVYTLPEDKDTLNTAGSTNSNSKLFLIGATSQAANPQTYSDSEVYTTNGTLTTNKVQVGNGTATMQYDSVNQCIRFVIS